MSTARSASRAGGPTPPTRSGPPRVDVLGVGVSCIDLDSAIDEVARWFHDGRREYICVTGMHGVMESRRDPELRAIHNRSGLTTPDGMPMVWAGRWAGARIRRVYGPELMRAVLARALSEGWSSYFLGGETPLVDRLIDQLGREFPGLVVAGRSCPPFRPLSQEEDAALVDDINASGADIVWVALGTPKQEHWMATHRERLHAPVLAGVGAAFGLLTGDLPQAPAWMRQVGLEWAYRLAVEPRRLWRRYLLNIPPFVVGLLRHPPGMMEGPSI